MTAGGRIAGGRPGPAACEPEAIVVVDGDNAIGATADGWWRDRPGAVRRLLGRMQCLGQPAILVLDAAQPDLPEGDHDRITVCYATRSRRDAADDRIRELIADLPGATVVTSDRALGDDVENAGCSVLGARADLARLAAAGCRSPSLRQRPGDVGRHDRKRRPANAGRERCRPGRGVVTRRRPGAGPPPSAA